VVNRYDDIIAIIAYLHRLGRDITEATETK
jgi:hypothetical protein